LCAVIGYEDGKQARRLCGTPIFADEVLTARRLEEALASCVDFGWPSFRILGPNCAGENID
jgi:hypothetical protein